MKIPKGARVYIGGKGGKGYVGEIPDKKVNAGLKKVIDKTPEAKPPKEPVEKGSGKP